MKDRRRENKKNRERIGVGVEKEGKAGFWSHRWRTALGSLLLTRSTFACDPFTRPVLSTPIASKSYRRKKETKFMNEWTEDPEPQRKKEKNLWERRKKEVQERKRAKTEFPVLHWALPASCSFALLDTNDYPPPPPPFRYQPHYQTSHDGLKWSIQSS